MRMPRAESLPAVNLFPSGAGEIYALLNWILAKRCDSPRATLYLSLTLWNVPEPAYPWRALFLRHPTSERAPRGHSIHYCCWRLRKTALGNSDRWRRPDRTEVRSQQALRQRGYAGEGDIERDIDR
jgi:hypothetical protein